jgi:hypothetical protein
MIPFPDLENLVKTRTTTKLPVNRYFDKPGLAVLIGAKSRKGIPVSVRIQNDLETRYFDDVPSARDLKEVVEFLSQIIVVRKIHES